MVADVLVSRVPWFSCWLCHLDSLKVLGFWIIEYWWGYASAALVWLKKIYKLQAEYNSVFDCLPFVLVLDRWWSYHALLYTVLVFVGEFLRWFYTTDFGFCGRTIVLALIDDICNALNFNNILRLFLLSFRKITFLRWLSIINSSLRA